MPQPEKDGTISLQEANKRAKEAELEARGVRSGAADIAKNAIEQAFNSPLDRPRGGREQKNLRPQAK